MTMGTFYQASFILFKIAGVEFNFAVTMLTAANDEMRLSPVIHYVGYYPLCHSSMVKSRVKLARGKYSLQTVVDFCRSCFFSGKWWRI